MTRFALILLASTAATAAPQGAISRKAAAFDISSPLLEAEPFIPDKPVTIHPAVLSKPEHQGSVKGPGTGLGSTPPNLPPGRAGRGGRGGRAASNGPAPPIVPPEAPEISAAGTAVEQSAEGTRPAIAPLASFDGLGEGFTGTTGIAGAGRGGIDISLAVGPDHIIEILNVNMAVYTKKGKRYSATG